MAKSKKSKGFGFTPIGDIKDTMVTVTAKPKKVHTDELEKALAKEGMRVVKLTDVTITKAGLIKAISKTMKIPGNEIISFAEMILKDLIMGG